MSSRCTTRQIFLKAFVLIHKLRKTTRIQTYFSPIERKVFPIGKYYIVRCIKIYGKREQSFYCDAARMGAATQPNRLGKCDTEQRLAGGHHLLERCYVSTRTNIVAYETSRSRS